MDRDGIAAELIYASVGMGICMHRDAEYKSACMWAYNRWLADMCADAPDRVFGMAQTAVLDVDSAIADFQQAKDMGMVGMMMPGRPRSTRTTTTPTTTRCGSAPADLQLPIAFHILTSRAGSLHAETRGHPLNNFLGIIRAIQDVVGLMTLGGVFERHPGPQAGGRRERRRLAAALHVPDGPRGADQRRGRDPQGPVEAAQRLHPVERVRHVPGRRDRVPHAPPVPRTSTCCGPATSRTPTRRGRGRAS